MRLYPCQLVVAVIKGVGRKFSREGATEKDRKIAKKTYRKIALLSLSRGGACMLTMYENPGV